jgi:hypothetical protein
MSKQLCEPILENGIKNTNFFNGRLLAAEDLQDEQLVQRQRHQLLGQTIGGGVVHGLEVSLKSSGATGADAVVTVGDGLAINSRGLALRLPQAFEVILAPQPVTPPQEAGLFSTCSTDQLATFPTGVGVYVLLLCPASGYAEQAPLSGLGANGKLTGCGRKYAVDGVAFRLAKLTLADVLAEDSPLLADLKTLMERTDIAGKFATEAADLSMLRNLLAHLCYGSATTAGAPENPFAQKDGRSLYATYGAIDALLAAKRLSADDVPLALVYWTTSGLRFVDMWSVRRRPAAPFGIDPWGVFLSDRRLREAEAMLLQFEEQLGALRETARTLETVVANDYFRYLPSATILPLAGTSSSPQGLAPGIFFSGLTVRDPIADPLFVEGAKVAAALRDSLAYPPIDLRSPELIWLYRVRENQRAIDIGASGPPPAYLVFTNGQMPYLGDARFELAYWNYSNYA